MANKDHESILKDGDARVENDVGNCDSNLNVLTTGSDSTPSRKPTRGMFVPPPTSAFIIRAKPWSGAHGRADSSYMLP